MLLRKCTVVVYAKFYELVVDGLPAVFHLDFCSRIDCLWIYGRGLSLLVPEIKSHRFGVFLRVLMVEVDGALQIYLQAVNPRNLIVQAGVEGMEVRLHLVVSAETLHVYERVAPVDRGEVAVGETEHLERGIAVGCIDSGVAGVLVGGYGSVEVDRDGETLHQVGIKFRRIVVAVAAYVGVETLGVGVTTRQEIAYRFCAARHAQRVSL